MAIRLARGGQGYVSLWVLPSGSHMRRIGTWSMLWRLASFQSSAHRGSEKILICTGRPFTHARLFLPGVPTYLQEARLRYSTCCPELGLHAFAAKLGARIITIFGCQLLVLAYVRIGLSSR